MSPTLLLLPAAAVLLALLGVAAVHGYAIAQALQNRRYRRAELRSKQREREIWRLARDRRLELQEAVRAQRQRSYEKRRRIYDWSRQFNDLLEETRK